MPHREIQRLFEEKKEYENFWLGPNEDGERPLDEQFPIYLNVIAVVSEKEKLPEEVSYYVTTLPKPSSRFSGPHEGEEGGLSIMIISK